MTGLSGVTCAVVASEVGLWSFAVIMLFSNESWWRADVSRVGILGGMVSVECILIQMKGNNGE